MSVVTEHLRARDIQFKGLEHPTAHNALDEALLLGLRADMIAKAVVLDTPDGHAVAVVSGYQRLDLDDCSAALGCRVTLATEHEVRQHFPEFEPGMFPAVPSLVDVPFLVDPEVLDHERVVVSGGDPNHSALIRTTDLFAGPGVMVVRIAEHDGDESRIMMA
ncbi:MAG TPA: YbaK/EbsC family protein [Euzebya sp.]|nr:YbaK/EbsC family protein [Euzebya sp.]